MARFEALKRDDGVAQEVFRLLTDDEALTLAEIAKRWRVPRGPFVEWFSTEHKAKLDAAERVLGIDVCHAVKRMTDEATAENFALVKFKTDRYLRLAGLLNAERYSPKVEHKHSGIAPTLVIEISGGEAVAVLAAAAEAPLLEKRAPRVEKVVESGELI